MLKTSKGLVDTHVKLLPESSDRQLAIVFDLRKPQVLACLETVLVSFEDQFCDKPGQISPLRSNKEQAWLGRNGLRSGRPRAAEGCVLTYKSNDLRGAQRMHVDRSPSGTAFIEENGGRVAYSLLRRVEDPLYGNVQESYCRVNAVSQWCWKIKNSVTVQLRTARYEVPFAIACSPRSQHSVVMIPY